MIADDELVFLMEHVAGSNRAVDGFYDATTSQLTAQSLSNMYEMASGTWKGPKKDNTRAHDCIWLVLNQQPPHFACLIYKSIS